MRVVVKVGSRVLAGEGRISEERMRALADFLQEIHAEHEVMLVSSGAVAAGHTAMPELSNKNTSDKQALAALGQAKLMGMYQKQFDRHNIQVAQILLTKDDFLSFRHNENAKNAVNTLLTHKVIPIINENDSVVVDEILRGDNDQLSAHVTHYLGGDLLIILSDIDGYYDKHPRHYADAKILPVVHTIPAEDLEQVVDPDYQFATGGIVTKLKAKKMFLASGFDLTAAREFLAGKSYSKGTLFCPPAA